ncbi:MAG: hypothetical protein V2J10_00715, partial [Wenzhouxiangella sp.]|nr:hypothetical protein [Wenzhouxiangella sp.]
MTSINRRSLPIYKEFPIDFRHCSAAKAVSQNVTAILLRVYRLGPEGYGKPAPQELAGETPCGGLPGVSIRWDTLLSRLQPQAEPSSWQVARSHAQHRRRRAACYSPAAPSRIAARICATSRRSAASAGTARPM